MHMRIEGLVTDTSVCTLWSNSPRVASYPFWISNDHKLEGAILQVQVVCRTVSQHAMQLLWSTWMKTIRRSQDT